MKKRSVYEIEGAVFSTLEEFYEEVSRKITPNTARVHNLDAFNDILRGGFGTPDEGFVIRWNNSELSRERLNFQETVRQLEQKLKRCHPTNRGYVSADLERAKGGIGPTVFDWIVEIIREHGPGGAESADGVELELR